MKYRAVIFDLFGTLVDMFPLQELKPVFSEMADVLKVPLDDFTRLWTQTFDQRNSGKFETIEANIEHMCQTLNKHAGASTITTTALVWLDFARGCLTPRPDAVDTLTQLKAAGYKIGLISDCSIEVPLLWTETPLACFVDVPIFSCEVGLKKPEKAIYLRACQELKVNPQDCLYIGDGSSHELTGALKVGMQPVLIRVSYEKIYDAYRPDAHQWPGVIISSLSEVLTLLE